MQVYEKSLLKKIVSLTQIGKQANLSHFFFFLGRYHLIVAWKAVII